MGSYPMMERMGALGIWSVVTLFAVVSAVAQPDDTVYVQTNKPQRTFSRYYHWKPAAYLWTVEGSGVFGQILGNVNLTADARFSLVSFQGLPQYPKLPLEDNGWQGAVFCTLTPSACRIFFATNARVDQNFTLEDMQLGSAEELKVYRFIPENDTYNAEHRYLRTVIGNNVKAQFLYVDRYGEAANQYYQDNTAVFRIIIQRKSPELLVIQPNPYRILNDGPPNTIPSSVFREEVLNFGQAPVGSGASVQFQRILKNRGLEKLQIRQILITGTDVADFQVSRLDGASLTQGIQLERWKDSIALVFRFQPTSVGPKYAEVLVLCNDPTQNATTGGEYYFRFILQGEGTQAKLSVLPEIDFGDVWVGKQRDTVLAIASVGNAAATLLQYSGVRPPFFLTAVADSAAPPTAPASLEPGDTARLRIVFRPTQKGRARDTLRITGTNIQPYEVVLKGRGLLSAAQIWHRWSFVDSLRDTIDFGKVSEGEQRMQTFTVRNLGNVRLTIPDKVVPYYELTDIIPGSKDEFVELFQLGCETCYIDTLTPYYDQTFAFLYDGTLNFPVGKKAARLRISIRQWADTSKIVATKEFILLAEKIPVRLNAVPAALSFDSVYVGKVSPSQAVRLWNISQQHAIWIDTVVFVGSTLIGEFRTTTDGTLKLQPQDSVMIPVIYQPADRGLDTAYAIVRYHSLINGNRRDDSVVVALSGVGVEQQLLLEAAVSGTMPPEFFELRRGQAVDTVDLGKVRVGTNRNVAVLIRNLGNVPIQRGKDFLYLFQEVTPNALLHYQVVQPHNPTIAIGQRDTVHLLFQPTERGRHTVRYTLSSNVPDRIATAPDSLRKWSFVVTAQAVQPSSAWGIDSVDFQRVVVLQGCPEGIAERSVRLTNVGDAPLLILAALIVPNTGIFTLQGTYTGVRVEPNAYVDFQLRFVPPTVGAFSADLVVHTDEMFPYKEYRIPLRGIGIAPPVVPVQLPQLVRVRPGHSIRLPVRWDIRALPALISQIDTLQFVVRYDKTILAYRNAEALGTAAENAYVTAMETKPKGEAKAVLAVSIVTPDPLLLRDTLIVLQFDTFLGKQVSTEVTINDSRVVVDQCEGVLTLLPEGGIVVLDSLCGLEQKLAPPPGAYRFRMQPVAVGEQVVVYYEIPFAIAVHFELFAPDGQKLWQWRHFHSQAGRYRIALPKLPRGLYFCRMRAGIFSRTIAVVQGW